jgi:glyoxylase-like metal-dependent hydrolase (beta-lactamase superfamily II)
MDTVQVDRQITALVSGVPIPGLGVLPVNAFVVSTEIPLVVDANITLPPGEFLKAVATVVDPADIGWIWLTHADRDHTGALPELLAAAPRARVITNFTSVGHLSVGPDPLPPERAYVVNSGDRVDLGDRELVALRPPLFDNPGTVGLFDRQSGVFFSSDFFGSPVPTVEDVLTPDVASIPEEALIAGQLIWGSADSPWVHGVDEAKFAGSLAVVSDLDARLVLSTHLPPIRGDVGRHLETVRKLPDSTPFVGPNQAAIEALLAELEPTGT